MKARNPNGGEPLEVGFPSGPGVVRWAKVCKDCGANAGGCFSGPGLPEPAINPGAICPVCGGDCLELRRVGQEGGGGAA